MTVSPESPAARVARIPLAAFLATFAFHAALAPRVYGDGDSGEFTLALALFGVPHPTGYPLFTLAGGAWAHALHAVGVSWPHAANLWSALGAAVTAAFVLALGAALAPATSPQTRRWWLAAPAVLMLIANPVWLRASMVAEVTSWHLALLAAVAWSASQAMREEPGRRVGPLATFGLACGLALGHHATAVTLVLPVAVAVGVACARQGRLNARSLAACAAAATAPLVAGAAFVAWRAAHPAASQWGPLEPGLRGVVAHLTGSVYRTYVGGFAPSPEEARRIGSAILPAVVPAAVALGWSAWRGKGHTRTLLVALAVGAALQLGFVLRYAVPDPAVYFLPILLAGLAGVAPALHAVARRAPHPAVGAPLALALLVAIALGAAGTAPHRRELERVDAAIRARWQAIPHERCIVFWNGDYFLRLRALQLLEGLRPGLWVEHPGMLTWERPRRDFERRFGFDPLAGLELVDDSQLGEIVDNVERRADVPVLDFATLRP